MQEMPGNKREDLYIINVTIFSNYVVKVIRAAFTSYNTFFLEMTNVSVNTSLHSLKIG